jgi:UDP-N-acetylmuramyl pentapeptide phosphotransferase/UDP-N-acetylglucosamine-1-phosphate transferase
MIYFIISFAISIVSIPFFGKLAIKYNVVEKKERSIPYLGGMGLFISLILLAPFDLFTKSFLTILAILGLYEDLKQKSVKLKVFIIIFLLLIVNFKYVGIFYIPFGIIFGYFLIEIFRKADNFDGVIASLSMFSGFGFYFFATSTYDKTIIMCLLGSLFAFIFYNFPPSRIQLGETGNYLISGIFTISFLSSSRGGLTHIFPSLIVLTPIFLESIPHLFKRFKYSLSSKLFKFTRNKRKMLLFMWLISGVYILLSLGFFYRIINWQLGLPFYVIFTVFLIFYPKSN